MSERVVHLSFPAKPDYLLLARLALSGLARELPLADETLADLKLAVTEACGNAVRHAYADGDGTVSLAFVVAPDRLEMIVEDQGVGISAPLPSEPADEAVFSPERGMGLSIIRAVVDELEVEAGADGRGTALRMTTYLPANGARVSDTLDA